MKKYVIMLVTLILGIMLMEFVSTPKKAYNYLNSQNAKVTVETTTDTAATVRTTVIVGVE